jgi:hypothetical protein
MRANDGANPKGIKEGQSMNDAQTLALIHAVAWPILILLLSKMIWEKNAQAPERFQRPVNALQRETKAATR